MHRRRTFALCTPRLGGGSLVRAVAAALLAAGAAGAYGVDGVSDNDVFRRNVSKTPALKTAKAKIGFSAPAYTAAAAQDSELNGRFYWVPRWETTACTARWAF